MDRSHKPTVLMYGIDRELLRLRSLYLLHHGYDVVIATSWGEVEDNCTGGGQICDLIFLCYSAPEAGRRVATEFASQTGIPIYSLKKGVSPDTWLRELSDLLQGLRTG
jgi:hypothetical protein